MSEDETTHLFAILAALFASCAGAMFLLVVEEAGEGNAEEGLIVVIFES